MKINNTKYTRTLRHLADLGKMIEDYEKQVSAQGHHCSEYYLTTMAYLINLYKYKTILDCGSGLTTAVLWRYKEFLRCDNIYTIDDNKEWLNKTMEFMDGQGIKYDKSHIMIGDKLDKKIKYDFISYDYSNMEARKELMWTMLPPRIDKRCMIMFDDAHKPDYEEVIREFCKEYKMEVWDLKYLTQREGWTGRYAVAGVK